MVKPESFQKLNGGQMDNVIKIRKSLQSKNKSFTVFCCESEDCESEQELNGKILIFVLYGYLKITDQNKNRWTLEKEDYILLPEKTIIHLQIKADTRYIEVKTERLVSPERELGLGQVHSFKRGKSLLDTKKIENKTILAGEYAVFMTMRFARNVGPAHYSLPGEAMLFAVEGKGEIVYLKRPIKVFEGQNVRLMKGGFFSVKTMDEALTVVLIITLE